MKEQLTVVTRKGQITVPAYIRRALDLKVGDKVAITLDEEGKPSAKLRPVRSVTEMTFGSVEPRNRPEDLRALREQAIADMAENALREGTSLVQDRE
ncbi:MAG: AbrB/MazE/SpoVT family DNA-binding domain-containing protein [Chloroflexota bacterium]|nr:MAG: hypothetical protein DLM70_11825 [Chloroflexota bacterium]